MRTNRKLACIVGVVTVLTAALRASEEQPPTAPPGSEAAKKPAPDLFATPIEPALAKEVDQLITDLASPAYDVRQQASARLLEVGIVAFAQLRAAYRQSDDLEQRIRIEQAVHQAYLNHKLFDRTGFLGIRFGGGVPVQRPRGRHVPEGAVGIIVSEVEPGTAAQRAGLEPEDFILALDDTPLAELGPGDVESAFADEVGGRSPGSKVRLTVLRDDQTLILEATLQRRPLPYFGRAFAGRNATAAQAYESAQQEFESWWAQQFLSNPDQHKQKNAASDTPPADAP